MPERGPKPSYQGENGFVDPLRLRVQGQVQLPNLHAKPSSTDEAEVGRHSRQVHDAVERRRFAEDVLRLKGSYFLGVAAAQEMEKRKDTAASIKESIVDLKTKHSEELQTLYDWQAEDYLEEMQQRCFSKDDSIASPEIDSLYSKLHKSRTELVETFDDNVSMFRYGHHRALSGLMKHHAALVKGEEKQRRERDKQFPADIAAYRAITNKDVQLRIARFLTADSIARDRMQDEFGWVWRQVQSLVDEYNRNSDFKTEIQGLIRGVEARDPRRRT
ncbi:hypothetical protein WOLCODRAFT_139037 [Wolfiporia cocos MD-104 SS10]|uniref:Uncharacterized protein n=1 Tax=Wolfiporia cocos (strain MD-104) TaxID=742152 RepID=A0A2H3K7T0_WOLCO|nr:hypothetical protein WOLCODRAFT_139037 [Wolfiporia cocos MD-104 SS10]